MIQPTTQERRAQVARTPLCVDLDGTLVRTDMLLETLLLLLKKNPLYLLMLPFWLRRGKAHLKQEVSKRVEIDPASLPYDEPLIAYLQDERARGRTLVLATAADRKVAAQIAEHIGLFGEVVASDGGVNRAGGGKLDVLREKYGTFAYAGNAEVDLKVWRGAAEGIVVSPSRSLADKAREVTQVSHVFAEPRKPTWQLVLKAARLHQWAKNALLFVPLVTAHQIFNVQLLGQATLAFVAFGLCASSVYLTNDMLDLAADRRHHRKRFRPFASGALPLKLGFAVTPLFLLAGLAVALFLPPTFFLLLLGYLVLTVSYSFYIKQVALLDVILLAGLYTVRIVGGAAATGITISPWLLAFSMFFFLSLAFVKRFSELRALHAQGDSKARARGYMVGDLEQLASLGAASGYISVLVMALYISSDAVMTLYTVPGALWLICPLMLYWISRVWLLARRGEMHDDPVVFALKDRVSYAVGISAALVAVAASWNF